ncbi:MAG TPA: hypothetical protein VL334_11990 [Anaerolineae bacterium]|nr:hypothetical protein [Anaerolineae bacterium]
MRDTIRGAALVYGLLAATASLLAALLLGILAVVGDGMPPLMGVTILVSIVAVGVGLGAPLAMAGWASWQRRASPLLALPPAWWLGLLFIGLLVLGQLLLGTRLNILLLPPLHVAASLLPPLLIVAAITPAMQRAGARLTRRNLITQFAYGGLVGTMLAIALESAVILFSMATAGVGLALLPGGVDSIEQLARELQSNALLADPMRLLRSLLTPGLVLGLGLLVALAIPLLEETVKSLGAWINGMVQGRLTRAQAFTFGVIAGVGFSFTEALFYAAQQVPHGWAGAVVLRGLTAVIHGASTGLFALGWYEVMAGRPARFWPYAAGGVAIHGLWNGLSGLTVLAGLVALDGSLALQTAGGAGAIVAVGLLGATWLAALAVLIYQTRHLSAELRRAGEGLLDAPR